MRASFNFALACVLSLLGAGTSTKAEVVASVFGGMALTEDNDLELRQSGGTDLTFHGVSYKGKDFQSPQYYGARLSYFLSRQQHWGVGVEFVHAKMYLNNRESVPVRGTREGSPVHGVERIDDTIQSFSISHGLNFLTLDALYRWLPGRRDQDLLGRFQPYVGLGLGAAIPHVESNIGGVTFEEYQWHGPAVQGFCGLNFDLTRHWSVFAEYKLSYVDLDLPIPGGSIRVAPLTHHLVAGLSIHF